jgi:glycosyltransferase involved in cell wall biosynthesis
VTGVRSQKPARILFDISTLCRTTGQATGIVRVERELARWAHANLGNVVFVFYETRSRLYRRIDPRWIPELIEGAVALDSWILPEANDRVRFIDRFPAAVQPAMRFVLRFRRETLMALEALRLETGSPSLATWIDKVQRRLMTPKYRTLMLTANGERQPVLAARQLLLEPVNVAAHDIVFNAGAGWSHSSIDYIASLQSHCQARFALLLHDIIPLLYPDYYLARDARTFASFANKAVAAADLILVGSRQVGVDLHHHCALHGLACGPIAGVTFGYDFANVPPAGSRPADVALIPPELTTGRFILFVSTIEPRKGHAFLLSIWQRLLSAGIPQRHDVRLVFVGRIGWLVDDLAVELAANTGQDLRLHHYAHVDDETLSALYANAAFCVYPSEYEGFGLPIVEAFGHGKAVIASDKGAIPETVGTFSPCLPARDEQRWYETMATWIADPAAREGYEHAIRIGFRHRTWNDAAEEIFGYVAALGPPSHGGGSRS